MSRVDEFRMTIQGRMAIAANSWAVDLFFQFQGMIFLRDVVGMEQIEIELTKATSLMKTNMDRAADSIGWRGYQLGRVDAMAAAGKRFNWVLDGGAENCDTCLAYAAGGPYDIDSLPGIPADAPTICNGGCRCDLVEVKA